jgi:hypothetical protein
MYEVTATLLCSLLFAYYVMLAVAFRVDCFLIDGKIKHHVSSIYLA